MYLNLWLPRVASALETNDNRSATDLFYVTLSSVSSLVTKLHATQTYFLVDPCMLSRWFQFCCLLAVMQMEYRDVTNDGLTFLHVGGVSIRRVLQRPRLKIIFGTGLSVLYILSFVILSRRR